MTSEEFISLINEKIVILDGATGSMLQQAGMSPGDCPEQWVLEHKDIVINLQKQYIKAGSDIIYAPTFTANRIKLEEYGLEDNIEAINKEIVSISKQAVIKAMKELEEEGLPKRSCYVAGDITMTGKQLYPIGALKFDELVDVYREQVSYLDEAGVDLIVVETMMNLQECRAAVLAVKETTNLPVMVTLSFGDDMRTLFGTDPKTAVNVLQSMGADAVGANCSFGADYMKDIIEQMVSVAKVPVIAKPNIGMPKLIDGRTTYSNTPAEYAEGMKEIIKVGAAVVGGCCGTNPECIARLRAVADDIDISLHRQLINNNIIKASGKKILSGERSSVDVASGRKFFIIGERINPTGKKALQAALKEDNMELVIQMAEEQEEYGADLLDVNVGMNGIDEVSTLFNVITELSQSVNLPLSIDTSNPDAMEIALRNYPGRALINSISLSDNMDRLLLLAKKYGAMFVLLPLSPKGLPKDLEEKKSIINSIVNKAQEYGIDKSNIIVDGLVTTVGANKTAALETLETIRYCTEDLGVLTVCGLSNISFGLPQRSFVNGAFVSLAISKGLTMAIANPMQDLLMNITYATDLLLAKPEADTRYVERITVFNESHKNDTAKNPDGKDYNKDNKENTGKTENSEKIDMLTDAEAGICDKAVYEAVLKGRKDTVISLIKSRLNEDFLPEDIINNALIPAINSVGELFAKGRYFLPQLMKSADTMKVALEYLEPMLKTDVKSSSKGKVVIATVKGDIHDIGKNLVAIMLKNYGFTVYDLGKNVEAEEIVAKAVEYDADIIGVSALMTTTMTEMKNVIDLVRERKIKAKVMIGGAVVTQEFADEIGADAYSSDANEAVYTANKLMKSLNS